jgi:hypothetical protein
MVQNPKRESFMAIAALPSSNVLTHYLRENPAIQARQLSRRATLNDIAAKVSLFAIFIITSAILVLAVLGPAAFSAGFLLLTVGLAIATPLLFRVERLFAVRSQQARENANTELGVAEQLKKLQTAKPADIAHFYPTPRPKDGRYPDILPLIARFNHWKEVADRSFAEARLYLDPAAIGNKLADQNREVRYLTRQHGWKILEKEAIPAKLQCALVLQLIAFPYQELSLSQIGQIDMPSMDQYLSQKEFDEQEKLFTLKNNRPPLSLRDIQQCSPAELREKIF